MKKIILASLIFGIILLGACTSEQTVTAPIQDGEELATTPIQEVEISVKNSEMKSIEDELSGSRFTLGTLALSIEGNNDAESMINDQLTRMQQEYISETKAADAMLFEQDSTLTFIHELIYTLVYSDDNVISIVAEGYDNNRSAPHQNVYRIGYVFSSQTGDKLSLEDILGFDYQAKVQASIIDDITTSGEIESYYPKLEELLIGVLSKENWYIKDDLIYLVINPYQIAPAALGVLEFNYPYGSSADSDI